MPKESMETLRRYRLDCLNPYPPPDRRFRLAKKYLQLEFRISWYDDEFTKEVTRFLRVRESCTDPRERRRLVESYDDIAGAIRLHHGSMREDRPWLEAYLLANASDESIGKRFALPEAVVRWFRLLFYDMDHLRESPLRVFRDLIGVSGTDGAGVLDEEQLAKLIGYELGSEALDQFLLGTGDGRDLYREGGLAAWLPARFRALLDRKQFLALGNLPLDRPERQETLIRMFARDGSRKNESSELSALEKHIHAMLTEIPWVSGPAGDEVFKGTSLGECDRLVAELRDEEVLLLAAGEKIPAMEEIRNLQFPAGRNGSRLAEPTTNKAPRTSAPIEPQPLSAAKPLPGPASQRAGISPPAPVAKPTADTAKPPAGGSPRPAPAAPGKPKPPNAGKPSQG